MKPSLKLNIIYVKNIDFWIEFLTFKENIKNDIIKEWEIPDTFYGEEKESIQICFKVSILGRNRKFYFDLFYGKNEGYLFVDGFGKCYQLYFKNMNSIFIEPFLISTIISNYDTNNTTNRKRVLLINLNYDIIKINNNEIDLGKYLPKRFQNDYSFNFPIYDLSKKLILSNVYCPQKKLNHIEFMQKYEKKVSKITKILEDLYLSKTTKEYQSRYSKIKKYRIKNFNLHLNFSNKELEKITEIDFIEFIFQKSFIYLIIYFNQITNLDYTEYQVLYKYCLQKISEIKNDLNLKIYEKILMVEQFKLTAAKFTTVNSFLNSDFEYYFFSKAPENSILFFVKKFINKFITDLNENNKAFFRLLELDAGIYYYHNKSFYSFDMKNLNEIKAHLKDIMNDIICFYNNEDEQNSSFCSKHLKYATINKKSIYTNKKLELNKKLEINDTIKGKQIASKIIINYYHEIPGHIKFGLNNYEFDDSPNKCIDEKNNIKKLVPNNSNLKNSKIIKILNEEQKSDSGTFFELIYGKAGEGFIKDLLENLNNFWKLVDRVDLFLDNLPLLSKYVKYRFIFEYFKLEEIKDLSLSIENEIIYMKKIFEDKDIDIKKIEQQDEENEKSDDEDSKYESSEENEENNEDENDSDLEENENENENDNHTKSEISQFNLKGKCKSPGGLKLFEDWAAKNIKDYGKNGFLYEKLYKKQFRTSLNHNQKE